jgi:hypothetical protein
VIQAFKDVLYIRHGTIILPFLKGSDFTKYVLFTVIIAPLCFNWLAGEKVLTRFLFYFFRAIASFPFASRLLPMLSWMLLSMVKSPLQTRSQSNPHLTKLHTGLHNIRNMTLLTQSCPQLSLAKPGPRRATTHTKCTTTGQCQRLRFGTRHGLPLNTQGCHFDKPSLNLHILLLCALLPPALLLRTLLPPVLLLHVLLLHDLLPPTPQLHKLLQHQSLEPAWMSKKRSGGLLHILTWLH